jgi:hypothetical protein
VTMRDVGGLDEYGEGSAGSGGFEDPIVEKINADPTTDALRMIGDPSKLPEIQEKTARLIDPSGNLPVTAANAVAYEGLDKALRDKLIGAQRGTGNVAGKGRDGQPGVGPGGSGANSTLGRNMRWTLRFKVSSGRDYLKQLETMRATLLIPVPGTEQCLLIENLSNPDNRRVVGTAQLGAYAGLLKFADSRRDAVGGVAGALGLDFTPKTFFAVFSKDFEDDLAGKETRYANRRAEDIEETIFKVTVRGGEYTLVVEEQKLR